MDYRFWINGTQVPPPDNWPALEIEMSFETEKDIASIRTDAMKWMAENAGRLNDWMRGGTSGGLGILEGPALRIEVGEDSTWLTVFEGCIDMTTADTTFSCDIINAHIRENKSDWLNDIADTISFPLLWANGKITQADCVLVPYVVSSIPDYYSIALMGMGMYMLLKETYETIDKTAEMLAKLEGDITTTAATVGLAIATVVSDFLIFAAYLTYSTFLVLALISLLRTLFNNLIQPLKYKMGIKVNTLFQKACQSLDNIPFSSTILQQSPFKNMVIIPQKKAFVSNPNFLESMFGQSFNRINYDDSVNPKAYGYYEGSFKDLLLPLNDMFNAQAKIRNNGVQDVLHYEVWDHFNNQAAFTMPPISSEAPYEDPYGTNASELMANYLLKFRTDTSELNTLNQYDGTSYQMILEPIQVAVPRNVLLKGLTRKDIPFALAKRKKDFTVVEKIYQFFYSIAQKVYNGFASVYNAVMAPINGLIKTINKWFKTNIPTAPTLAFMPANIINQRLNAMLLESDFMDAPKVLIVDANGYIDPINDTVMTAKYLQENFHSHSWAINTLVPSSSINSHNQFLTFKNKEIPMCLRDFVAIKGNNIIKDAQGRFGRIDSMRWNANKGTAVVDYRIKQRWTNNLKQKFIVDGN